MQDYLTDANSATNALGLPAKRRKSFNNLDQASRRKIAREVAAMWDDIARAAGFEPIEWRTAFAISTRLYERAGQDCETPRGISLAAIGAALTSRSDDETARANTARNRVGQLFNHAIPRTGYQILTRYKAEEESGKPHEYADHLTPVAALFSEELAKQTDAILSSKGLDRKAKAEQIAEARARLVAEALTWVPKCEVEIVTPRGQTYAYVSEPEAKAYCERKPEYKARAYQYREPEAEKPKKPYLSDDLERLKKRAVEQAVDTILNAIGERNGKDTARAFWVRELLPALEHAGERWVNYCRASDESEEGENRETLELIHVSEFVGVGVEKPADVEPSENYDDSLTAALDYVRDGWAIVPCRDKKPLIGGKIKNAGHTAASRDKGLIREWFTEKFKGAGVAIRLDGHILIDVDVKDGKPGLASYDTLADTFDLPATLTQLTPSGGRHHIFKLPDSLPAGYLGNWTDFLAAEGLGGIDIKTGTGGLCHVEPTRTDKGVYRWVDPTADIAELPMALCEYFHGVHKQEEDRKQAERAANATRYASTSDKPFDPDDDQGKYFKDAANGERRPRLRTIACSLAARGANENQIVDVLKYHDGRFSQPTNDVDFMLHVAAGAVTKFGAEVQQ